MTFDTDKKKYLEELYKPDRSKKGGVDMEIAHVIDRINENKNLYTTSSCAGRIDLLKVPRSGKKNEAEWLFVSHAEIRYEDLIPALTRIPGNSAPNLAVLSEALRPSPTTHPEKGKTAVLQNKSNNSKDSAYAENQPIQESVWFRQESPIFHIAARSIKDAQKVVDAAKLCGFKRSGIMATNKRVMIELMSTEFIDTIIAKDGQVLVSEDYLKILVHEANKKLHRARQKAEKFFELIKEI